MNYLAFSALLGLVAGIVAFNKENKIIAPIVGVIAFLFFGAINWLFMPTLNFWGYDGVWIEVFLSLIIGLGASHAIDEKINIAGIIMALLCIIGFGVRWCCSSELFHTEEYKKLLTVTEVEDSVFQSNIHPIPVEKMISVKQAYAEDLASKRIENMASLGSRCQFGKADMINLNGTFSFATAEGQKVTETFDNEKVWIMPLEHKGFWKWRKNKTTEGYCIVSAHNPGRIFFITELNGEPLKLRYLESGCFGDYIERYVRTNGYASYGLNEYSMELDDTGRPYWVITIYEPTIGFSGEDAIGALIVDMQTGDIQEYTIEDAPEWVDLIQPDEFLIDQINDWGQYQDGYWNACFAQNGVRQATPGMSLVYSEGRSYWYTGIQSAGADKSSSGFMLIDTRTKECKLYPVSGINEEAAKDVVEAQSEWVRQSRFQANDPVLYNVHGVPTYYMTLTGDGVKNAGYAFVSLKSELDFAAAATPQEALRAYLKALQNSNEFTISDGDKIAEELIEVTVRDIIYENGTYYVLFKEIKGKEFTGTTDAFPEMKWTKVDQQVKVSYTDTEADVISLNSYDITDFEI